MDSLGFYDPADVPPSPRAFNQYEENRRKETGAITLNYSPHSYYMYTINVHLPFTLHYQVHSVEW